jgi:hypothetical protein
MEDYVPSSPQKVPVVEMSKRMPGSLGSEIGPCDGV